MGAWRSRSSTSTDASLQRSNRDPVDVLADHARFVELLGGYGPSLHLSHTRAFSDGLFRLRLRSRSGIGRTFCCFTVGKHIVVLHAFIKKSRQTPEREQKMARRRLKGLQDG